MIACPYNEDGTYEHNPAHLEHLPEYETVSQIFSL